VSAQTSSRRAKLIQASPIRKLNPLADAAKKRGLQVFHLNIGQPDIPTPPDYWEAMKSRIPEVLAYGPSQGIPELRSAICTYYNRLGTDVRPEQVMITTGGSEAVIFAMLVTCDEGDDILCFEPFYTNYNGFATMAGVNLVPIRSKVEDGFHLPPRAEVEKHITPKTRAILICNPNNPTGTVLRKDELEILAGICEDRSLFFLADEVYRDFTFDGRQHFSVLELPSVSEKVIVMDSISKRFSSCGARLGNVITRNSEVMDGLNKFGQARLCPPTLAQYGAAYLYEKLSDDYFKGVSDTYQRRRDVLVEELEGVKGIFFLKPEGAFYATIRIPVDDGDRFAAWMLSDFSLNGRTTMVAPAAGFYATPGLGTDEIRIAYVLNEDKMRASLEVLRKGLEDYPGRKDRP
jgi:aspartate aminotransferase